MNIGGGGGGCGVGVGAAAMKSPFTVSQWQELEHQALIYKYMVAGLPVPPDLVLPIQKSFDSISQRFFHHPSVGYCSFYGKKVDPEPGRCRRTDGKKWRCSKDAYPDSKYCERHMHRGRNRSRKPVESQTSSSSVASLAVSGTTADSGSFQNLPLSSYSSLQSTASATNQSHYNLDAIPYGIPSKDYRYAQTLKPDIGEHSFIGEGGSGSENVWPGMPTRVSPFTVTKSSNNSVLRSDYPFFSGDYTAGESVKPGSQSLRPFLDEWPKNRDSWSSLEDDRSNPTSFSTTRLSISTPLAPSGLSTPSSQSPHDN